MGGGGTVRGKLVKAGRSVAQPCGMTLRSPFRYFKTNSEAIRLAVMMYVRYPLSLRDAEDK
jgi:hypothetical protein